LKKYYPLFYDKLYTYDTQKIEDNCGIAAAKKCKNAYIVRKEVILSYPTAGCQIRDVTKKDVENDIKYLETNADKLNQSTLLDRIDFCQAASDKGYSWWYQKPALDNSCVENKPKKKSKKK
jgi:hypothetical protein